MVVIVLGLASIINSPTNHHRPKAAVSKHKRAQLHTHLQPLTYDLHHEIKQKERGNEESIIANNLLKLI